jgi:hypothetical protein
MSAEPPLAPTAIEPVTVAPSLAKGVSIGPPSLSTPA